MNSITGVMSPTYGVAPLEDIKRIAGLGPKRPNECSHVNTLGMKCRMIADSNQKYCKYHSEQASRGRS